MPDTPVDRDPDWAAVAEQWSDRCETAWRERDDARNALNGAYRERAHLVALLAALHPSHIGYTDPEEPGWAVVIIDTPGGQLAWHIAPDDRDLFTYVRPSEPGDTGWDGHTTEQKYERIRHYARRLHARRWSSDQTELDLPWHTLIRKIEPDLFTGEPAPSYQLLHPDECRYLPPGAVCWASHDAMAPSWPQENGRYRIRPETVCTGGDEEPDYETYLAVEPENDEQAEAVSDGA
jgi:hypothetical protein